MWVAHDTLFDRKKNRKEIKYVQQEKKIRSGKERLDDRERVRAEGRRRDEVARQQELRWNQEREKRDGKMRAAELGLRPILDPPM